MNQTEIIGDGTPGNSASVYGQLHKSLYLIWSQLADGVSWNSENIPESSIKIQLVDANYKTCLLYTSPSPRDATLSRMPSSA